MTVGLWMSFCSLIFRMNISLAQVLWCWSMAKLSKKASLNTFELLGKVSSGLSSLQSSRFVFCTHMLTSIHVCRIQNFQLLLLFLSSQFFEAFVLDFLIFRLQVLLWEFCARGHEELLPRRLLVPQVPPFLTS